MPTTTKMTDAEVIERSKADGDAFVELFHRHFDAIHRYVARRAGRDAADEVSAETFVQAFRSRHNYTSTSDSALPWLYGIAGKLLLRRRRSERRHFRAVARLATDPGSTHEADQWVSSDGERRALAAALLGIAVRDREALLLLAWADLSYSEIAEATSVPVGTVRSRINRARRQLRSTLGDDDFGLSVNHPIGGSFNA